MLTEEKAICKIREGEGTVVMTLNETKGVAESAVQSTTYKQYLPYTNIKLTLSNGSSLGGKKIVSRDS